MNKKPIKNLLHALFFILISLNVGICDENIFILPIGEYNRGMYLRWKPSISFVYKIDSSLYLYIKSLDSAENQKGTALDLKHTHISDYHYGIKFVIKHYFNYKRQYLGCYSENKYTPECDSIVTMNASLPTKDELKYSKFDYNKNVKCMFGGGPSYWEIQYDKINNKFIKLSINANE